MQPVVTMDNQTPLLYFLHAHTKKTTIIYPGKLQEVLSRYNRSISQKSKKDSVQITGIHAIEETENWERLNQLYLQNADAQTEFDLIVGKTIVMLISHRSVFSNQSCCVQLQFPCGYAMHLIFENNTFRMCGFELSVEDFSHIVNQKMRTMVLYTFERDECEHLVAALYSEDPQQKKENLNVLFAVLYELFTVVLEKL